MSCSLPLPLAIFWASAIWFLTACSLSACARVNPPNCTYFGAEVLERVSLNGVDAELGVGLDDSESARKEELLVAAGLLDDLDQTRLQLLDGRNVIGEDTHITGLGGKVDLDAAQSLMSVTRNLESRRRLNCATSIVHIER